MKINKREKRVCGVGINDADYKISSKINGKRVWCPFYMKWASMLSRCYSEKVQERHPTYVGCSTAAEWFLFSTFKYWMEKQDWEGKELDKDILFPGNKIYGPDTCVFVEQKVNTFIIECNSTRGEWPIGVCWDNTKGRYTAFCQSIHTGKLKTLGRYSTPEEAHKAWLSFKLEQAYILASQQTDERVAKALIDRYKNYTVEPQPA